MGIGSSSNTQAGPIGVSSGSGVGLGGGANIPGLGALGNGANPLSSILGKKRRRRRSTGNDPDFSKNLLRF